MKVLVKLGSTADLKHLYILYIFVNYLNVFKKMLFKLVFVLKYFLK